MLHLSFCLCFLYVLLVHGILETLHKLCVIHRVQQSPEFPSKPTSGHLLVNTEMDNTPPEKSDYELARDRRAAEVQKKMAPVVAAL